MSRTASTRSSASGDPDKRAAPVAPLRRGSSQHANGKTSRRNAVTRAEERANVVLIGTALVLILAVVFARMLGQNFSPWDDSITVYANPYLNPVRWGNIGHFWTHAYEGLYIPLSYTAFAAISLASQSASINPVTGNRIDPALFHLTSLILHAANVLLVFMILRGLVRQNLPALLATLLFALHPLQVESVAWIPELRGLLSSFWCLLAIWWYLRMARVEGEPGDRVDFYRYFPVLLAGVLALLCKPSAIALPVIIFALDRWIVGRALRHSLTLAAALALPGLIVVGLTSTAQPVSPDLVVSPLSRLFVAGDALAFYLEKLVVPVPLTIVYGRTPMLVLHQWWGYATWATPALLAALIWWKRRQFPWLVAAGWVGLGALLPNLGLLPFAFQGYSTVADRYAYLALLGPALALAYWLKDARSLVVRVGVPAVLCCWAVLSVVQIGYWDNGLTLWSHAADVGGSDAAYANYGKQQLANNLIPDALVSFQRALHLNSKNAAAHGGLGTALLAQGQLRQGIEELRTAIHLDTTLEDVHYKLGAALVEDGQVRAGLAELRIAVRVTADPVRRARTERALRTLEKQLRAAPRP